MNITQKLVAEVRKSNAKYWHDQEWHNFQGIKEVIAVNYALTQSNADWTLADVVNEAKKYLQAVTNEK